jgi:methylglutaconyl-CoA hydratase
LLETAMSMARSLAEGGPQALATTKELLRRCSPQAMTLADFANASAEPRMGQECLDGLEAFFAKRSAPWVK